MDMDIIDRLFGQRERTVFSIKRGAHTLAISDNGDVKTFRYDDVIYSKLNRATIYTREYWDFFMPLAYIYPRPKILMVGLGGGTIAFQLTRLLGNNIELDIVEKDAYMTDITSEFLENEVRFNAIIEDGAAYVARNKDKYDIIILDAYESGLIPRQFLGREFVGNAKHCLKKNGILAINCIGSMVSVGSIDEYIKELRRGFDVYKVDTSFFTANMVLICAKGLGKGEIIRRIADKMEVSEENRFLLRAYEGMRSVTRW